MERDKIESEKHLQSLLQSEFLTAPTRRALIERVEEREVHQYFDSASFNLLSKICDLLVDQNSNDQLVNIAHYIDERLKQNRADGWRYSTMPDDRISYKMGLQGIKELAFEKYQVEFLELYQDEQREILKYVQQGEVQGEVWKQIDAKLFFEDLLAETAEIYFSHPVIQMKINYVGMADAKGWTRIKLNEKEYPEI